MPEKVEYRPCPNCDGWLVSQATKYQQAPFGHYEVGTVFVCTTCGHEEIDRCVPETPPA